VVFSTELAASCVFAPIEVVPKSLAFAALSGGWDLAVFLHSEGLAKNCYSIANLLRFFFGFESNNNGACLFVFLASR